MDTSGFPASAGETLPDLPDRHVARGEAVSSIDRVLADHPAAYVRWPTGAGKTVLLTEFVQRHRATTLAYFVTGDLWSSQPERFLFDLCQQLAAYLDIDPLAIDTGYDRVQQLFPRLWDRFSRSARTESRQHYLVIDSVDAARKTSSGESFLAMLPRVGRGVAVLLSGSGALPPEIQGPIVEINDLPLFGELHTTRVLADLDLSPEQLRSIQASTGGLPAYVAEVGRRLSTDPKDVDTQLAELPTNLASLLEREWQAVSRSSTTRSALAVVAYAPEALGVDEMAEVLGQPADQLGALPFVRPTSGNAPLSFLSGIHRDFVVEKLRGERTAALLRLVDFYQNDKTNLRSIRVLPGLLEETRNFETLKSLVTASYLSGVLQRSRDLSLVRRSIDTAMSASRSTEDLAAAAFHAGAESLVMSTYGRFSWLEAEVTALCAVGEFEEAVGLADRAVLPEDQVQALAVIGDAMQTAGKPIPEQLLTTLDVLSEQIPSETPVETATEIAKRVFAIRPEQAVALVERCAGEAGTAALDRALIRLGLGHSARLGSDSLDLINQRVSSSQVRDALASTRRLGGLTPDQLIEAVDRVENPRSAISLLRGWCNVNRRNPDAISVVRRGLELLASSTSTTPALRDLRQISEPLSVADAEEALSLVGSITALRDGLPPRPWLEAVRLDLLLAHIEARAGASEAQTDLARAVATIAEYPDLETRCLSRAHLCRVMKAVGENVAGRGSLNAAIAELTADFSALLEDSGDHLQVGRPIIKAVARFDPLIASLLALDLNYPSRRDQALSDVLTEALDHGIDEPTVDWSIATLREIEDLGEVRGPTLIRLCRTGAQRTLELSQVEVDKLAMLVAELPDPGDRAPAFAWLARWARDKYPETSAQLVVDAEQAAIACDEPWVRRLWLLALVGLIEPIDNDEANRLLHRGRSIAADDASADTFFGPLYGHTLLTAAHGVILVTGEEIPRTVRLLRDRIALVPSPWIQADLLGTMAARLYGMRSRDVANDLVAEMVTRIGQIEDAYARGTVIARQWEALFEHDPRVATELLSELQADLRNVVLQQFVASRLAKKPLGTPLDLEKLEVSADQDSIKGAAELLPFADRDWGLTGCMRLIARAAVGALESRRIVARTATTLANEFDRLAEERLPDPRGIHHDGYLLLARSFGMRLRIAARKGHTEDWRSFQGLVERLPNAADRVYVLAVVGGDIAATLPKVAASFTSAAAAGVQAIPSLADRLSGLETVAGSMVACGQIEDARSLVVEAFQQANSGHAEMEDDWFDRLLDLAEAIDPELAGELTRQVDSAVRRYSLEETRDVNAVRRRPATLTTVLATNRPLPFPMANATEALRRSLASNRLGAQSKPVALDWLAAHRGLDYPTSAGVFHWLAENAEAGRWTGELKSQIEAAFIATSDYAHNLGDTIYASELLGFEPTNPIDAAGLSVFRAGEGATIRNEIARRLRETDGPYVVWIDPYFRSEQLELLASVPDGVSVRIVTSEREQKDSSGRPIPVADVARSFAVAWRRRFDVGPPHTTVVLLGTPSGQSPIHDRHLLTPSGGVTFGGSANTFGDKDTAWHSLSPDECALIEADVNRWLTAAAPLYKGEPVLVTTFTLAG